MSTCMGPINKHLDKISINFDMISRRGQVNVIAQNKADDHLHLRQCLSALKHPADSSQTGSSVCRARLSGICRFSHMAHEHARMHNDDPTKTYTYIYY